MDKKDNFNLSVEEIIEQYSSKAAKPSGAASAKKSVSDFDVDEFLASLSSKPAKAPQKTEVIEDVLEIGDNSRVFEPEEETAPREEKSGESVWEIINGGQQWRKTEQEEENAKASEPLIPEGRLRTGARTTQGTQAIEQALELPKHKKPEAKPEAETAKPEKAEPAENADINPISEHVGDTEVIQGLMKLKRERGGKKPRQDEPINRATINDVDLGIEKKVIPNTEMGIDENASESEKLAYLNSKRREMVKDFVSEEEKEAERSKSDIEDFESFDQAEEMSDRIESVKQTMATRVSVLTVLSIISAYLTFANGPLLLPILTQPVYYVLAHVAIGLVACVVSRKIFTAGLKNLFTLKADSDSLAAVASIFSLVSAFTMLDNAELVQEKLVHVYISVSVIGLLINSIGKLLITTRAERNFKYISGGYSKYAAIHVEDEEVSAKFTRGALTDFPYLATSRKTEFVRDFQSNSYSADLTDTFSKFYVPIAAGVSLLVGVVCLFIFPERITTMPERIYYAIGCAAGTMSLCSAMGMMLVANIPLARASKKYLQSSAVMLGYSAVEMFADTNSLLVDAVDLFPDGMVDIVNIKPARSSTIEEGIIFAASLCCQTESILRPAFYKMIKGKTEMLLPVDSHLFEDGLGLSGWIDNKRVLFGSRTFMESHSIDGIPTPEKEAEYAKGDNIVYLSVSGRISMIFVIKMKASVSVSRALKQISKDNITVIIRSVDSLLSLKKLSELFDVSPNTFKLLPFRYHTDYDNETSYIDEVSSPMIYSGRFASLVMLLSGAKKLQRSASLGVAIQAVSAALGAILAVIFALMGTFAGVFNGTTVLIYAFAWALFTAIVQSITKT